MVYAVKMNYERAYEIGEVPQCIVWVGEPPRRSCWERWAAQWSRILTAISVGMAIAYPQVKSEEEMA
jgi:hypothetical protein